MSARASIIIPLYNKEGCIGRAIASVLNQTEASFELIVVDDGSTDNSCAIVRGYTDPRIHLVQQANSGPGAARNAGAQMASTELFAFLDADDEWKPEYLATAVGALEQSAEAAAYVCGYDAGAFRNDRPNKIDVLGKSRGLHQMPLHSDGATLKIHVDAMHSSCVTVRREVFEERGGYFAEENCRYGEDSYLWLGVLMSKPIFFDPDELVLFHVEDSVLGFATTARTKARPISLYPQLLRETVPNVAHRALDAVVATYAEMDYRLLRESGARRAAATLARERGLDVRKIRCEEILSKLITRARQIKRRIVR